MPAPPSAPSANPLQAPPTPQQMGSVTLNPQNVAVSSGQTLQFIASVAGGGALTWSVNGIAGGNSTVGTVDTAGNYTAPAQLDVSASAI